MTSSSSQRKCVQMFVVNRVSSLAAEPLVSYRLEQFVTSAITQLWSQTVTRETIWNLSSQVNMLWCVYLWCGLCHGLSSFPCHSGNVSYSWKMSSARLHAWVSVTCVKVTRFEFFNWYCPPSETELECFLVFSIGRQQVFVFTFIVTVLIKIKCLHLGSIVFVLLCKWCCLTNCSVAC